MGRFGVNREFAVCDGCGHPRMAHFGGGCYCGCTSTVASQPRAIRRVIKRDDMVDALFARVSTTDKKADAWDLIKESARLRALRSADEALAAARRAVEASATAAEKTAGTTMVVATLCDLWRDEEARCEGEAALQLDSSPYLLRALGRAWFLGFAATGVESFRSMAHDRFRVADELEAVAV